MSWTLTINFANDALNAESKDAFAAAYGWTATVPDPADATKTIPNPESKAQFRDRMVKQYCKEIILSQRTKKAQDAVVVAPVPD